MRRSNVIKEGTILLECKELQKHGMFTCKAMHNFLFVYAAQSEKSQTPEFVIDLSITEISAPQLISNQSATQPQAEPKCVLTLTSLLVGDIYLTLPRFNDAEEWFLVLFAAKSMQSTPLLDRDNSDLSENDSSIEQQDNSTWHPRDLSASKTSLRHTLANLREIEPLTLQEAKAMADERFVETLLTRVDQVSVEMKKKLESLQDEIVVHEQEYKSLTIQENVILQQLRALDDAIQASLVSLENFLKSDAKQVQMIHSLFNSRVKAISLVYKIQETLEKTSAESLMLAALTNNSQGEGSNSLLQALNPEASFDIDGDQIQHGEEGESVIKDVISLDRINNIIELSSQVLETDVKPLLTQFQNLLQYTQLSRIEEIQAASTQQTKLSGFDSIAGGLSVTDTPLEHLFVLSEVCTSIRSAANNAANSIQQLAQARNAIM